MDAGYKGDKPKDFTNDANDVEAAAMGDIALHEPSIVTSIGKKPRVRYT